MIKGYSTVHDDLHQHLHWSPADEVVDVYRSEAPHDGFELIAEDVTGGHYEDILPNPNENRMLYYKVNDVLLHLGPFPGPIAQEIIRRDNWFLSSPQRHSGAQTAMLYVRRTLGAHCSECWDEVQQKVTRSKCLSCHGTGLEDPYYAGLSIQISNGMPSNMRQPQADHIDQTYNSQVWTTNFPRIKPGDVMRRNSLLWRVEGVQSSSQAGVVVKQMVSIKRLEVNREEYTIPFGGE